MSRIRNLSKLLFAVMDNAVAVMNSSVVDSNTVVANSYGLHVTLIASG